ncbi:unnamed protein product [Linum trigynum]|uniref:Uncharacterized protein n=1 Tax=Linum trigynum TaxID=586398 RepID=A0AAV2D8A2_9ROSI
MDFVKGAPKWDSPWYKDYFFARPSWMCYSGDAEPLTGYAAGLKDDWCAATQFPQSVKDHVVRIVEGVQIRVRHNGPESIYQHVRALYGLRELADANKPKKRKAGNTTKAGGASASAAEARTTAQMVALSPVLLVVGPPAAITAASVHVTRGAGKRVLERSIPKVVAKRAKPSSTHAKA